MKTKKFSKKMNKFKLIKIAVIGLTIAGHLTTAAAYLKPQFSPVSYYLEPTKQILIQGGNAL
jgi:hypothetical protein